jgi:uncharacterized phage-associated protein
MAKVTDVANFILKIAKEDNEDGAYELISHMKLQKLIYYCQGFHLALCDTPLYPDTIIAWKHGPVCEHLYHILKAYGSSPIAPIVSDDPVDLTDHEKQLILFVYENYGQYSASKLRSMTHSETPWSKTPLGQVIAQEELKQFFNSLIVVNHDEIPPLSEKQKNETVKILEEAIANGEIDLSEYSVGEERHIDFQVS